MKNAGYYLLMILFTLSFQSVSAQEWIVPNDQSSITNPSEYNLQNVNRGKDLYLKNCKSCHGDAGKNNALPLVPIPPDVTSEKMQANTEGALFYKITKGRGTMPQFETQLSEDDRWRVINYIMNFNPSNEPLLVDAPKINAKLLCSVNENEKKIEIFAEYEKTKGVYDKLVNAPILINAKKTFGSIKIGEATTDQNGRAVYSVPESVAGDINGKIDLVISLDETYKVDNVVLADAKVATPGETENLFKETVLWGTNDRLQPWLLVSYLSAALGAWMAILYVIYLIVKIKLQSRES